MFLPWQIRGPLYDKDDPGGGGGGVDTSSEEFKKAVAEYGEKEAAGLKKVNSELKAEKLKIQETLKKFEGFDPEEYAELKKAREETERQDAEKKGQWEKLETQLIEKHTEKEGKWKEREDFLMGQLEKNLVTAELTKAIAEKKGSPELLLHPLKAHVKVFEENGEIVAKVVGKDGAPRVSDDKGAPVTISGLVEEFYNDEKYQRAFDPSGVTGSGSQPGSGGGSGGGKSMTRTQLNALEGDAFEQAIASQRKGDLTIIEK